MLPGAAGGSQTNPIEPPAPDDELEPEPDDDDDAIIPEDDEDDEGLPDELLDDVSAPPAPPVLEACLSLVDPVHPAPKETARTVVQAEVPTYRAMKDLQPMILH